MSETVKPDYCCEYQRVDGRGHAADCVNYQQPRPLKDLKAKAK